MDTKAEIVEILEEITSPHVYIVYDDPPSYSDKCRFCWISYGNANLNPHTHTDDCLVTRAQAVLNELESEK